MTVSEYIALFVLPAAAAFFGSYLRKKGENLATHEDIDKLVTQVSAVTAATKQIEAKITHASRVYERQLDILAKLYRHLHDAQALFQNMTCAGRLTNEISPESYIPRVNEAMRAAFEELLNGRSFIPEALVQLCEEFFKAAFRGQLEFELSLDPNAMPNAAEFSQSAAIVAHQQLSNILRQIDEAARGIIHD